MDDDDQHRSDDRSIIRLIEKRGKYDIGGWKQKICANTQDLPDAEVDDDNALSSSTSINGNTHIMPTVIHFLSS